NYTFIDATYQTPMVLQSPNNPAADVDGNIQVLPGDHIPGLPSQRFKAGAEYTITDAWTLGADFNFIGSQYLIHDDSNQNPKVPVNYAFNLTPPNQLPKKVDLFGLVQTLLNKPYSASATSFTPAGSTPPGGAPNSLPLNDPPPSVPEMPSAAMPAS